MRRALACCSLLLIAACGQGTKASSGRTERETDSVIANSKVPNAKAVGSAMRAADTVSARNAAVDTAGQ
ncbi:MAG: hypothetical protein ACHQ2E_11580 [Gemmatimonadales bacterium]